MSLDVRHADFASCHTHGSKDLALEIWEWALSICKLAPLIFKMSSKIDFLETCIIYSQLTFQPIFFYAPPVQAPKVTCISFDSRLKVLFHVLVFVMHVLIDKKVTIYHGVRTGCHHVMVW